VVLSYRKAKRQQEWERIIQKHKEGDTVSGVVTRKIKGGLLVNIGVHVFLPASQVDIRRPADIGHFIGKTIDCKIMVIDEERRNIVVSRRQLIEDQRTAARERLMTELQPGQIRKGIVKNIADFGAFVDLGGMDGLLHVTDMSWGRVSSPHDVVKIDQELEVFVIRVESEKGRVALGLKQLSPSPWQDGDKKYPVGSRHTGEVVNVMSYGAFVKLEPGIEGLVHISEMSWTKRINHPNELVKVGDQVEVEVLNINRDKQEISLGMKQVQPNPWDKVVERYQPGTVVSGTVRNLTNYGAFIEIEEGIDGLLHVSDMSWVRKVSHPSEVVNKGDKVTCTVLNVDQERKRIALGLKQMASDPWEGDIPSRYHPGDVKKGKVTKLTNFGVFVELEQGLEGLLHISELADHKVESPEEVVKVGDEIEVKVLRVDAADRKIKLSRKSVIEIPTEEEAASAGAERPRERELRGGTGSERGNLITMPVPPPNSSS
jgi:small subunit ribosomal protein S1